MEFPGQSASKDSTIKIVIAVAIVVVIGAVAWYFGANRTKTPPQPAAGLSDAPAAAPASTLGGTLYESANNPIQNKLPDTVAPVPNPLQDAYKNPFQ